MHDSIYKIQTANLLKINDQNYTKIDTSGFINHPPQVISYKNNDYLIYPSKKKYIYDISLMAFKYNIEYPVDQNYISSYHPLYFQNKSLLDLFFISFNSKSSYISYKPVQINQIENLRSFNLETKPSRATSLNYQVQNFTKSKLNQMRYLFFKVKEDSQIYFTKTDDEATAPSVRLLVPKNSKSQRIFPEIAWDLPDDPSGIIGYGYVIDQRPSTTPSIINLPENERMITTRFLDVGNYFFHIVAVDSLNNVSEVTHTPFAVEDRDNAVGFNIKKIFVEEELTQLDISDEMAYPTYKEYIEKAHALIVKNKYHLARNYINLASIINPSRIESYVMLQLIDRHETKWTNKYKMHMSALIFILTILLLTGTLYRLSHK